MSADQVRQDQSVDHRQSDRRYRTRNVSRYDRVPFRISEGLDVRAPPAEQRADPIWHLLSDCGAASGARPMTLPSRSAMMREAWAVLMIHCGSFEMLNQPIGIQGGD